MSISIERVLTGSPDSHIFLHTDRCKISKKAYKNIEFILNL